MEQKNDFLGKEPVGKLLLRLSLPAIAAQIVNLLYNMVDRIYIGHMPEVGGRENSGQQLLCTAADFGGTHHSPVAV